ncbi:DUF7281 domain-containing protein [Aromatoleum aromaticum]|uniref:DUF7281 domain-containing protein n=1 Tax=Aromatoleum aromaticum (strain DSM 19018 / LMG 30748 / EbN1) TaxID=76114 RepID=Q5NWU7_AROAE|nr:hypothetical protein [Aromatoleum aromaticum]CAI10467.1 conserved hypothetical protein [Aromatoleum aromaticum EbN1]
MEKRLIDTLIRIVQSPETQFLDGAGLKDFRQRYGIGFPVGTTRVRFSDKDKAEIASLLKAKAGIDAAQVKPGAWQGLTRAEALDLGHEEKLARGAVKRDRISLKAVPGQALKLSGRHLSLPDYAHVDINWREITALGHPVALVVENYEVFDGLLRTEIAEALLEAGYADALVIYRGDATESRMDNVLAFLSAYSLPVIMFGDLDPASLVEASTFPNALAITVPEDPESAFCAFGNASLYARQVGPAFERLLDSTSPGVRIGAGWIHEQRKGLVQESMIGRGVKLRILLIG